MVSFRPRRSIASQTAGLRYTNFHSTSLCSPTRAAIITGRNHHVAGFGVVGEAATGFPGYDFDHSESQRHHWHHPQGEWLRDLVVRQGSQHALLSGDPGRALRPVAERYGLRVLLWLRRRRHQPVGAEPVPQYDGDLPLSGQSRLESDHGHGRRGHPAHEGTQGVAPEKPFFVYYVPGGTHAPHHPTPEWIKKISDMHLFDEGWNKLRETIFANQKRLGIMPANAKLTPWPKELPEWDSLSFVEKKLFIKQADVYGAYLAYTDHEIGRVIQAVEDLGQLDNTLIIYISGDNGASAEGMLNGTPNEFTYFHGVQVPVKDQFLWYPFWGSDRTFPHYRGRMGVGDGHAVQVGEAGGVALRRYRPGRRHVLARPYQRRRRHPPPVPPRDRHRADDPRSDRHPGARYDQRHQAAAHRRRELVYTWDKANANAPTRHTTQYFEMLGNRAIYHDGWVAATTPATLPWELSTATPPDVITGYNWELYNVQEDPTQFNDLAGKMPEKLKEMQDLFYSEAKKYDVLPLDNSTLARFHTPRPSLTAGRTVFTYTGELTGVPTSGAPNILNKSYTITAEIEIPEGGAEGMIVTEGGRFGGYGLFLSKGEFGVGRGKVVFLYNLLDLKRTIWEGPELERRQAHRHLRLQVRWPGLGQGRDGRAVRGRSGSGQEFHGTHHPDHVPGGRNLRHWPGHPHPGRAHRVSLRCAVQVHRQDRQADLQT